MRQYAGVIGWGFVISALGSLPLGALNVTAMQVAISMGIGNAILFSLGVAVIEVTYVRLSLVGIHWLRRHATMLRIMDIVSVIIVVVLAAGSFYAAAHPSQSKSLILATNLPFFVLGFVMSALNPVQIPFWLGWSSFLFSKKVLLPGAQYYNWYTFGIGLGTLCGLAAFVYGGRFMVDILKARENIINYVIAFVFLITAFIQLIKLVRHKGLAESTEKKAAELEAEESQT